MDKADIGRRMAGFRERRGLSMQDVAKLAGKSQATISRIENGKQTPNIHALAKLAGVLKVHPFALLSNDPVWHFAFLPSPETACPDGAARILAFFIAEARARQEIPLADAARRLEMNDGEMEAIESGFSIPSKAVTAALADLYGQPREEWAFLRDLEAKHPALSARLATLCRGGARSATDTAGKGVRDAARASEPSGGDYPLGSANA